MIFLNFFPRIDQNTCVLASFSWNTFLRTNLWNYMNFSKQKSLDESIFDKKWILKSVRILNRNNISKWHFRFFMTVICLYKILIKICFPFATIFKFHSFIRHLWISSMYPHQHLRNATDCKCISIQNDIKFECKTNAIYDIRSDREGTKRAI